MTLAFVGYYFGYWGVGNVEDGPDELSHADRLAVVAAGFGGFLAHGGTRLDRIVMRAAGGSEREAKVRVTLLGGLEHGILAIPCSVAAILLLAEGSLTPPLDFTIPWAIGPWVGFAVAYRAAEKYRARLRRRGGRRQKLSIVLDATHLVGAMFRDPRRYWQEISEMLLYWLNPATTMVAFGTAMIVTRRTGPSVGSGSSKQPSPRRSGTAERPGPPQSSAPSPTASSPSGCHSPSRSRCCHACGGSSRARRMPTLRRRRNRPRPGAKSRRSGARGARRRSNPRRR